MNKKRISNIPYNSGQRGFSSHKTLAGISPEKKCAIEDCKRYAEYCYPCKNDLGTNARGIYCVRHKNNFMIAIARKTIYCCICYENATNECGTAGVPKEYVCVGTFRDKNGNGRYCKKHRPDDYTVDKSRCVLCSNSTDCSVNVTITDSCIKIYNGVLTSESSKKILSSNFCIDCKSFIDILEAGTNLDQLRRFSPPNDLGAQALLYDTTFQSTPEDARDQSSFRGDVVEPHTVDKV